MAWYEKYKYGEDSEICRLKQENKKLIEEIKEVKRTSGYKISELDMLDMIRKLQKENLRLERELKLYKQFFAGNHVEVVLDEDKKYVCFTPEDMIKLHEMKLKLYNEFYSNNKVDEVKKDD